MAVKATNQITIVDITDAYNVILTSKRLPLSVIRPVHRQD